MFPLRGFLTWTPVGGEVENWTGVGPEEEEGGREEEQKEELAEEEVSAEVGVTAISWSLQSWFSDTADDDELKNMSSVRYKHENCSLVLSYCHLCLAVPQQHA